jgi:hypothetical protein
VLVRMRRGSGKGRGSTGAAGIARDIRVGL